MPPFGQVSSLAVALLVVASLIGFGVDVCCETYKFCDKVQTDALVNNELGNPHDLETSKSSTNYLNASSCTTKCKNETTTTTTKDETTTSSTATTSGDAPSPSSVTLLNLIYDVTPPDLITCVVTDMGMLPCTSVPVVLRLKNRDLASLSAAPATSTAAAARKTTSSNDTSTATATVTTNTTNTVKAI